MADNPFRQAMAGANGNPFRAALEQMPEPQPEPVPMAKGVLGGFLQGVTFGFADEAAAGLRALVMREDGEDFESAYTRHRDNLRGQLAQFRQESPITAIGSEMAGALVPGIGTAGAVSRFIGGAAGTAGRIGRAALVGAGEGAVYGAGTAPEVEGIPGSAGIGAAIGGALGAAAPAVIEGGRAVAQIARGGSRPSFGADFRIAQALARDGMAPEDIARRLTNARRLGRPATLADVGGANVRRELETAVQSPGAGGDIAEQFLTARNREQLNRLSRDLVRGTGSKSEDVLTAIERTMKTRSDAAAPVYEKAMQFQAELNDQIVGAYNRVVSTPIGKQALPKARRILNVENFDEAPLMQRLDAVKRGIDDVIDSARRKGERQIARSATRLKAELLEQADQANPTYRQAREIWEEGSSYLEAIDTGRGILSRNYTSAALQRDWKALTDAEREAFRIGAVDSIITRMRQESAKEPNLLKLLRAPEIRDKLSVVMPPAKWRQFERIVDMEETMFETATAALRGSPTARRAAAMAEQNKQMRLIAALGMVMEVATSGLKSTLMLGIPSLTRMTRDAVLSRQNALIAQRLLSATPPAMTASSLAAAPRMASPIAAASIPAAVAGAVGGEAP